MIQEHTKKSMSTSHPYQNSNLTVDEQHRWIIHIRRSLDEDLEQETDIPVSIFDVPRTLLLSSPESYVPQKIALGPYHHSRPELYEMERYKLAAARRFRKHTPGLKFQNLVDSLISLEPRFRSCYQRYLNFNSETIAWMMAIDSCFLLEFLRILTSREEGITHAIITGRKSGCDAIIRDVLMLENQVPLFSLRTVIEFQFTSLDQVADDMLCSILIGFCNEVSPFKTAETERPDSGHVAKSAHLLDLMYRSIVLDSEGSPQMEIETEDANEEGEKTSFRNIISKVGPGPVNFIRRLVVSRPVKFILTLPWKIISNLPGMIMLRQIEHLCFSQEKVSENSQNYESSDSVHKHPLMEEISIPCVTELAEAGIRFSITDSILGIEFDQKSATLYLPTVCLDVNTEVVLRNLVAYEACNASGPLIFTRYTELMNGIIDGEDDAKVLRENGIVLNHLKCDADVADLWNGMSRSVRLTKVPFLDRVIEDVNDYYRRRWKVRIGEFLKSRVFGSWRCMTLLGAVWVLFFMSLQSFCSVFGCARTHHRRRGMS